MTWRPTPAWTAMTRHRVGDDVVQLAGDAQPLGGDGGAVALLAFPLEHPGCAPPSPPTGRRWRRLSPASHATAVASKVAIQSLGLHDPAGWASRASDEGERGRARGEARRASRAGCRAG